MRYRRLDLNLLTALRALLTEKNVTRAGEKMYVSQSAMSGILARLREYFDDQLIVPVGRKMELTPLGESLIDKVNELLIQIDITLGTRPDFNISTTQRHFSIVASDYVTSVLLADVLREVHQKAPGFSIEFRQPSATAYQELESGEVDFVINPNIFAIGSQSTCELFADTYHVLVDSDNTDIGDSISLEQYNQSKHVIFQNNGQPMFETWYQKNHGNDRDIEVFTHSFNTLPDLLLGTKRVGTVHTRLAKRVCEKLPVRMVKMDFETPTLQEVLQWHHYRDDDLASIWLREQIVAQAQKMPPID